MTNRDKLMEELDALSDAALYDAMADNHVNIAINIARCADCKAGHGGRCAFYDDDDHCPATFEDWMEAEARETAILPEA